MEANNPNNFTPLSQTTQPTASPSIFQNAEQKEKKPSKAILFIIIITIVVIGLGAILLFQNTQSAKGAQSKMPIAAPTATIVPSPTIALQNPFPTETINPFDEEADYKNPFENAAPENEEYENPFNE